MKRLASTLPNMILSLTLVTAIAGALLGLVYSVTKEPIAKMEQETQTKAIAEVCPQFNNNPEADKWIWQHDGHEYTVYPAKMDGQLVGAAVKTLSMDGFAGEIDLMVGFRADGTVNEYTVLKHAETPGLGSKMQMWFHDPTGARSIIDKNPATTKFYVTKDSGGEIDAITAATISSRAFLGAVRDAWQAYQEYEKSNR